MDDKQKEMIEAQAEGYIASESFNNALIESLRDKKI